MRSTVESVESPLDVVVEFSPSEWQAARCDIERATSVVIEELGRHRSRPQEYFAVRPRWITRFIPWRARIRLEIEGHFLTNDRSIRFSEWWIVKLFR